MGSKRVDVLTGKVGYENPVPVHRDSVLAPTKSTGIVAVMLITEA